MLPTHTALRYAQPLREGGSLPALVETDAGLEVVKFRGAGQGARALLAELVVGGIARALGSRSRGCRSSSCPRGSGAPSPTPRSRTS